MIVDVLLALFLWNIVLPLFGVVAAILVICLLSRK